MISQSEKTNPISKMPKMNVNLYVIEDYENEPPSGPKKTNPIQTQFLQRKNKPKTKPISSKAKMNLKSLSIGAGLLTDLKILVTVQNQNCA